MMFDESRLRDPGFFRENRVEAHSDHTVVPACRLPLNAPGSELTARLKELIETE